MSANSLGEVKKGPFHHVLVTCDTLLAGPLKVAVLDEVCGKTEFEIGSRNEHPSLICGILL